MCHRDTLPKYNHYLYVAGLAERGEVYFVGAQFYVRVGTLQYATVYSISYCALQLATVLQNAQRGVVFNPNGVCASQHATVAQSATASHSARRSFATQRCVTTRLYLTLRDGVEVQRGCTRLYRPPRPPALTRLRAVARPRQRRTHHALRSKQVDHTKRND